jgi:hypothetical protein
MRAFGMASSSDTNCQRCTASEASTPARTAAEALALVGEVGVGRRRTVEGVADLEQADAVVAVRPVVRDGTDQAR